MASIEEKVESLVSDTINNIGYEVYDVMYVKEGKDNFLRIFIDNDKGISLDDCEKVNNAITDMLDEANYIKEQYFLEISSPGVERVIRKNKHLQDNLNKEVYVKTYVALTETNSKEITGNLIKYDDNNVTLEDNNKQITIERKNIALMKRVYKW